MGIKKSELSFVWEQELISELKLAKKRTQKLAQIRAKRRTQELERKSKPNQIQAKRRAQKLKLQQLEHDQKREQQLLLWEWQEKWEQEWEQRLEREQQQKRKQKLQWDQTLLEQLQEQQERQQELQQERERDEELLQNVEKAVGFKKQKIIRPPGTMLLRFAEIIVSPKTYERDCKAALADWHDEYFEALAEERGKAKMAAIRVRHTWSFIKTLGWMKGLQVLGTLIKSLAGK